MHLVLESNKARRSRMERLVLSQYGEAALVA